MDDGRCGDVLELLKISLVHNPVGNRPTLIAVDDAVANPPTRVFPVLYLFLVAASAADAVRRDVLKQRECPVCRHRLQREMVTEINVPAGILEVLVPIVDPAANVAVWQPDVFQPVLSRVSVCNIGPDVAWNPRPPNGVLRLLGDHRFRHSHVCRKSLRQRHKRLPVIRRNQRVNVDVVDVILRPAHPASIRAVCKAGRISNRTAEFIEDCHRSKDGAGG